MARKKFGTNICNCGKDAMLFSRKYNEIINGISRMDKSTILDLNFLKEYTKNMENFCDVDLEEIYSLIERTKDYIRDEMFVRAEIYFEDVFNRVFTKLYNCSV